MRSNQREYHEPKHKGEGGEVKNKKKIEACPGGQGGLHQKGTEEVAFLSI